MTARPFVVSERVRWSDCDPMGIIRYDAYTRFFELGESEMFESIGAGYREIGPRFGITLPRRVMHMDFVSPPWLGEMLEVDVYVPDVRTTSFTINFDAYGEGGLLRMAGWLVLVCVAVHAPRSDARDIEKAPLPAAFVERLLPHRLSVDEARQGRTLARA